MLIRQPSEFFFVLLYKVIDFASIYIFSPIFNGERESNHNHPGNTVVNLIGQILKLSTFFAAFPFEIHFNIIWMII